MGDRKQLGHVIDNLVNNGLAYSSGPPRISITTSTGGDRAMLRVADQGIGISDDLKATLFEPFRRGRQKGFEEVPGSGLGLYISRELAVAHRGDLALEATRPGGGSTFTLTLPLHVTEPAIRA
jgi:signal transduction histidine kinase